MDELTASDRSRARHKQSLLAGLECLACGGSFPPVLGGTCTCGSPLVAHYAGEARRPSATGLWSWTAVLPPCAPVSLGERPTPLVPFRCALIKDEGHLPTGTFKARGAAVGVAMAVSLGSSGVALPSAGNAGVAWAAYCAEAGLPCFVVFPGDAPAATIETARRSGAEVSVEGTTMTDSGRAAARVAEQRGWHLAATFREPWRLEGKKTAFFETCQQLDWRMPDAIVVPVGGGVGLVAAHLAAAQARALGWASGAPRLYAVQAAGCAPVVAAFERGADATEPWRAPRTAADGIRIPNPVGGRLVLRALRESGGAAVAVTDEEIVSAQGLVARETGIHLTLEAAAAAAGYLGLARDEAFGPGETVVVYGSGSDSGGTEHRATHAAARTDS
jgi:threonine synthase